MKCKKCGNEMKVELVAEKKKRSLLSTCLWITLCVCTCGIILLIIPALRGGKTQTTSYFVCDQCGHKEKAS